MAIGMPVFPTLPMVTKPLLAVWPTKCQLTIESEMSFDGGWSILCKRYHMAARTLEGTAVKTAITTTSGVQQLLERREAELVQILRKREGIPIEKSADPMDEIQYASEGDLAIRSADLESGLLRQVRGALRRFHEGTFGACIECESAISPKRLAAVPWAARCIECQEAADRDGPERTPLMSETLVYAA